MSWTPGADRVRELLDASELERVEPSTDVANRLVIEATRHVASAEAISAAGDMSGAYSLAYDALRKSAASLLAVQGLRATSRGGHIAVQDTVIAQFGDTVRCFRAFSRLRRNRNRFEYPGDSASEAAEDDVEDALKVAREAVDRVSMILTESVLSPWDG
ncbi:MAG: HEPN domain-containing protein [Actinomycetota bacterium]